MISAALLLLTLVCPDTTGAPFANSGITVCPQVDTVHKRAKAVEVSDFYELRLRIHRYASYATVPLFVAQTVAGNQLIQADKSGAPKPGWASAVHGAGAGGLAVLFGLNTVTGVWNLYDSRTSKVGRTKRWAHSILLLASDAGFAWAGASAGDDGNEGDGGIGGGRRSMSGLNRHRNIAYVSMGTALVGYSIMLIGKH